ncbi:hypothetical protein LSM04_003878 [Trypanosoma melophagium]|uniref:uncharacterized protein n=1 Tax=Trypanosoma melophagium TaxID=715481 RepID=UPI00351A8149|nr:hypothetical protein LSM04_003878 [Trypanosoma melophagium]
MVHDKEINQMKELINETDTKQKVKKSPSDTSISNITPNGAEEITEQEIVCETPSVSVIPLNNDNENNGNNTSSPTEEDDRPWELVERPVTVAEVAKNTLQEMKRVWEKLSKHDHLMEENTRKQEEWWKESQTSLEVRLGEWNEKLETQREQLEGEVDAQMKERKQYEEAMHDRQGELEASVKKLKKKLEVEVTQRKAEQETHKHQRKKLESQIKDLKKELEAETLQRKAAQEAVENLFKDMEAQMEELKESMSRVLTEWSAQKAIHSSQQSFF